MKTRPDAAYEMVIVAFNPTEALPDLEKLEQVTGDAGGKVFSYADSDLILQFAEVGGDAVAVAAFERALENIAHGECPMTGDYRVRWGSAIAAEIGALLSKQKRGE